MSAKPLTHLRLVLAGLALTAVGSLGLFAAARVPGARADSGLPLPSAPAPPLAPPSPPTTSVSIPSLPITVPTLPLPGATTGTTTTGPGDPAPGSTTGTTPAGTDNRGPAASSRSDDAATVAGAVRLRNGRISIPATSVASPARLIMSRVRVLPAQVRTARQKLLASFRVSDSRGYLVRNARVDVRSIPTGRIRPRSVYSRIDGSVTIALQTTPLLSLRPGILTLLFASYVPGQARSHGPAARSLVHLPVRPAR
jgi:hypothetical protein